MAGNVRRTWDKELYEKKAKERSLGEDEYAVGDDGDGEERNGTSIKKHAGEEIKEEFLAAEAGAAGPMGSERAFIRARSGKIDLDSDVGKTKIVTAAAMEAGVGAGYWCEVCACLLKDSNAYLDHINGKKHQKALGFSMRVERVGTDVVKNKLDALKRKLASSSSASSVTAVTVLKSNHQGDGDHNNTSFDTINDETRKKRKKDEQDARRKEREEAEMERADPEIAELMGFGGFGSSKRK